MDAQYEGTKWLGKPRKLLKNENIAPHSLQTSSSPELHIFSTFALSILLDLNPILFLASAGFYAKKA